MRVFVSHSFDDENLATTLVGILKEKEIVGYMAQRVKEYEILIRDKVKSEISDSDYVVAIVTLKSFQSASVNQEIGYALGKGIPVVLMVEDSVKKSGVLTHGVEQEVFIERTFSESCNNIRQYLITKGKRRKPSQLSSDSFLKSRRIIDADVDTLGVNENSSKLNDYLNLAHSSGGHVSFILFSACPTLLLNDIDVAAEDFSNWIEANKSVKIGNDTMNIIGSGRGRINLRSRLYESTIGDEKLTKYTHFNRNGYLEQGFTYPLFYDHMTGDDKRLGFLSLGFTTATYWAFLTFLRSYYGGYLKLEDEIDCSLIIHNCKPLILGGFGGKTKGGTWAEPTDIRAFYRKLPTTDEQNIILTERIKIEDLNDEMISMKVKTVADRISNAYDIPKARCYNDDGTFVRDYFHYYDG